MSQIYRFEVGRGISLFLCDITPLSCPSWCSKKVFYDNTDVIISFNSDSNDSEEGSLLARLYQ